MLYTEVIAGSIRSTLGETKTEAKTQALSWLASQLQWEDTLDALREDDSHPQAA